ncbi:putative fmu [Mycobacterium xenopi 4042]|uniref:Putative fmu n=1 Tax=Mycobacterium xenopi 4042 TaxID=1299334 RepID=X7YR94_MYCXE|nr:putative fmu [Mycobacterium xenopi 4042]
MRCYEPSTRATSSPGWRNWPRPTRDPIGYTAFVHAHPRWIAQAFADALGPAAGELDALLASDDERPQVHLAARPRC